MKNAQPQGGSCNRPASRYRKSDSYRRAPSGREPSTMLKATLGAPSRPDKVKLFSTSTSLQKRDVW